MTSTEREVEPEKNRVVHLSCLNGSPVINLVRLRWATLINVKGANMQSGNVHTMFSESVLLQIVPSILEFPFKVFNHVTTKHCLFVFI